jgi:hypothetical protein
MPAPIFLIDQQSRSAPLDVVERQSKAGTEIDVRCHHRLSLHSNSHDLPIAFSSSLPLKTIRRDRRYARSNSLSASAP